MRKFSELEKKIIKSLVEGANDVKSNFPINILDKWFCTYKFDFYGNNPEKPILIFRVPKGSVVKVDDVISISMKLFEISMLLNFLEENGLIQLINYNGIVLREWTPNGNITNYDNLTYVIDKKVADALVKCINNSVFVGQTLKDMVDNDFKSIEEQALDEAKKQTANSLTQLKEAQAQTKLSLFAVVVALIGVVVAVLLSRCSVTLDEKQELFKHPIKVTDSTLQKTVEISYDSTVKLFDSIFVIKSMDSTLFQLESIKSIAKDIQNHQADTLVVKKIINIPPKNRKDSSKK